MNFAKFAILQCSTEALRKSLKKGSGYMKKLCLGLALFAASAANASVITVDFKVFSEGGDVHMTGAFSGTDNDNNGLLSFAELLSFVSEEMDGSLATKLAGLNGFGDYDIKLNQWLANGISWDGFKDNAWFTWNSRNFSVNTFNARVATTPGTTPSVPAPASISLFALGLAGLVAARRRKYA